MAASSQLIPEFILALQEEIDALKKGKGGSFVKVFNGHLLRESSGYFIYLFNLENFLIAIDDTPAEIEIDGSRYHCQIVSAQGLEVQIALEKNFGQNIAEAKIQTNLWYLLEILRKKYEDIRSSPGDKFKLSEMLFAGVSYNNASQIPIYAPSKEKPNDAQEKAVAASFSKSLAVIWGPPGTGKTKIIAAAVEAHINAGRRVLLVSHANTAVDEAMEKVAEQLITSSFYQEGKLIRLGICKKDTLEKEYPLVILDNIGAKLGKPLAREKEQLLAERTSIDNFLESYQALLNVQSAVSNLSRELNYFEQSLSELANKVRQTKTEIDTFETNQLKNREALEKAVKSRGIKRLFLGLDPKKLQLEIDRINITIEARKRAMAELKQRESEMQVKLKEKKNEYSTTNAIYLKYLIKHGTDHSKLPAEKKNKEARRDTINSRIADINKALEEIQKHALDEALLVATTLTKTFTAKHISEKPFDTIIIDESSMAPLPHIYWAASMATSFVTIVGDFLQLPPICISDDAIAQKWLKRSIFEILEISNPTEAKKDERVSLLEMQYRMAPTIAEVPNRLFYEKLLKHGPKTKEHILKEPFGDEHHLVVVDTSSLNPWCSHLSTGGRFNIYSALVSATLAKKMISYLGEDKLGVIAPYRAQARLIDKITRDMNIRSMVRVDTVHSFQGGEEKAIILDCVEGPGVTKWSMIDDKSRGTNARLLLNVALTRAKCKIFLIVHRQHLLSSLNKESVILRIIDMFISEGHLISSDNIVDSYLASDFDRWVEAALGPEQHHIVNKGDLFTEKNFWPVFTSDLRTTQQSLTIMSPFISLGRAGKMMDLFRSMTGKGISVRVFTRPPYQQSGNLSEHAEQVIGHLESIGAKVVKRKGMHQKIAVIDGKIAWEGSLNILSHKDTQEQMRRFDGENAVREIIRNLELDKDYGVGNMTDKLCAQCLAVGIRSNMVVRQGRYGTFWACTRYPVCRHTENISNSAR